MRTEKSVEMTQSQVQRVDSGHKPRKNTQNGVDGTQRSKKEQSDRYASGLAEEQVPAAVRDNLF